MVDGNNAPTALQILASALCETAQTAQEICEAEIVALQADDLARLARTAAALESCPVTRRSRTLKGRCTA